MGGCAFFALEVEEEDFAGCFLGGVAEIAFESFVGEDRAMFEKQDLFWPVLRQVPSLEVRERSFEQSRRDRNIGFLKQRCDLAQSEDAITDQIVDACFRGMDAEQQGLHDVLIPDKLEGDGGAFETRDDRLFKDIGDLVGNGRAKDGSGAQD